MRFDPGGTAHVQVVLNVAELERDAGKHSRIYASKREQIICFNFLDWYRKPQDFGERQCKSRTI